MDLEKNIDKTVKDVQDGADEAKHRFKAGMERGKRDAAGDAMTTSEKISSRVKEAGDDTAAEFDKAKRKIRDNT